MELRIQLQKDDPSTPVDESFRLYPPYLVIKYGQQVFVYVPICQEQVSVHEAAALIFCVVQVGTTIPESRPVGAPDEYMRYPAITFKATYCMDLTGYWYVTMILFILLVIGMVIRFGIQVVNF